LEVNCETDFVARTDQFQKLCHDLAMHVAALDPQYVRREDVPREIVARELEMGRDQARQAKKPESVIEKIATGKLEKFYEDHCLYEQHFIKEESLQIKDLIEQSIAKLGEKISVRRFVRMKVGDAVATYAPGSAPGASPAGEAPPSPSPVASPPRDENSA
jgi:elongation factor Ts